MKKIIYLLLFCVATANVLCACNHRNEPCDPYNQGRTYYDGRGNGETEGDNPDVNNQDGKNPMVCDDYYNRYQLADGVNIFLSESGTLYWYDAGIGLCPKVCWADLSIRRDGYYVRVYRLIKGEMRQVDVFDSREHFRVYYDILLCDTKSPDRLYPRRIEINNTSYSYVFIYLLSLGSTTKADETYHL